MRQEQKAHDASYKRHIIGILFFILIRLSADAQTDDFALQKNLIKAINYPEYLKHSCTPAFTNILIDISIKGDIQSIYMSDSAPKALKEEFIRARSNFNTALIKTIIDARKLKNCGLLIPVLYVYGPGYCTNTIEPADYITEGYFTYQYKAYDKLTLNLKPIIVTFSKPME
jgi:hypothetical protein